MAQEFLRRLDAGEVMLTSKALTAMKQYRWPGNVRELENVIERAIVLRQSPDRIAVEDLPEEITSKGEGISAMGQTLISSSFPAEGLDFSALEQSLLQDALRAANGNGSRAARLLGMTRQTFLYRLRKFGIKVQ